MSTPTGSDASDANERLAARLSRSSASCSFVRFAVPFISSPAVSDAISRRSAGAKIRPAQRVPESASVGLK